LINFVSRIRVNLAMAVMTESIIMYAKLSPGLLANSMTDVGTRLEGLGEILFNVNDVISEVPTVQKINIGGDALILIIFLLQDGSHSTVKLYKDGLVNIDVQFSSVKGLQWEKAWDWHDAVVRALGGQQLVTDSNVFCTGIRRGQAIWPYNVSSDNRILEADWNKLVFEITSPYQNIKIVNSPKHGHTLLLDNDIMIAESDLIYTTVLCGIGDDQDLHRECYRDKEVLILGGGDGGILNELLKEKPKFITMAEIDDEVIKASRKHLRGVCFDALDRYEGDNHRIILDDCVKVLEDFASRGKKVDFVINDLTEYPADKMKNGYDFEKSQQIFELATRVLRPGTGKVLARGNCVGATDYHPRFQASITKMGLSFNARTIFVPSFMEEYLLYEIFQPKIETMI